MGIIKFSTCLNVRLYQIFYERKQCKWYYPIASIAFPLAYAVFLLIQAVILKFDSSILIPTTTTPLIYPYFFVNLDTQGVSGVLMWIGILSAAFVAVGFLFFGLDKLGKKQNTETTLVISWVYNNNDKCD